MNSFNKKEIYDILKSVKVQGLNISCYQEMPETLSYLPTIIYSSMISNPKHQFLNEISYSEVSFQVDFFANKSEENTKILEETVRLMTDYDYQLKFIQDMGKDKNIYRLTTRFDKII